MEVHFLFKRRGGCLELGVEGGGCDPQLVDISCGSAKKVLFPTHSIDGCAIFAANFQT